MPRSAQPRCGGFTALNALILIFPPDAVDWGLPLTYPNAWPLAWSSSMLVTFRQVRQLANEEPIMEHPRSLATSAEARVATASTSIAWRLNADPAEESRLSRPICLMPRVCCRRRNHFARITRPLLGFPEVKILDVLLASALLEARRNACQLTILCRGIGSPFGLADAAALRLKRMVKCRHKPISVPRSIILGHHARDRKVGSRHRLLCTR
jgi:hypothetical protein